MFTPYMFLHSRDNVKSTMREHATALTTKIVVVIVNSEKVVISDVLLICEVANDTI